MTETFKLPERGRARRRIKPGQIDYTPYQSNEPQKATPPSEPTPTPEPVEPAKPGRKNKHVNLSLPIKVVDQAQSTWAHVAAEEDLPRFAHFVTQALLDYIKKMEDKHNNGQPYPETVGLIIPTGAPRKN